MRFVLVRVLLALLGASLLALSQPPDGGALWALVALVPWIAALRAARPLEAVALGALSGTFYGCLVAPWIPEALRVLGSSPLQAFEGWVATAAWVKAGSFAALAVLVRGTRGLSAGAAVFAGAAGVAVLDGVASRWGTPWALLGHSQLGLPGVAQLAFAGGVPAISALLFALAMAVVWRQPRLAAAIAGAWLSLAVLGMPWALAIRPPATGAERTLLVVQPDLPRGERWADDLQELHLERVRRFVASLPADRLAGVDALLLPENLLTSPLEARPDLERALRTWVDTLGIPVVTGMAMQAREADPERYRSTVVWIEPGEGVTARVDKVRAVPLLESARRLPGERVLAPLFGDAARWKRVEEAELADTGPLRGDFTAAPVLCYEALFPHLVAARRVPESLAILNLADDSWVAGDRATRQLTAFATFRAIEQRLPLVRVAHGGLSVVVDAFGSRTETLPLDTYASTRVSLGPSAPPSTRERASLLALPIGAGLVVWWLGGFFARDRA